MHDPIRQDTLFFFSPSCSRDTHNTHSFAKVIYLHLILGGNGRMLIIARMRLLERHPNRLGDPKEAPLYVPETLSASPSNKSVERQGGGGEGKGGGGGGGTPSRSNGMQVSGSFGRGTALRPTSLPTSKFSNLPPEFFPISSLTPYNKSVRIVPRLSCLSKPSFIVCVCVRVCGTRERNCRFTLTCTHARQSA
jgi:hypothetical protein